MRKAKQEINSASCKSVNVQNALLILTNGPCANMIIHKLTTYLLLMHQQYCTILYVAFSSQMLCFLFLMLFNAKNLIYIDQ